MPIYNCDVSDDEPPIFATSQIIQQQSSFRIHTTETSGENKSLFQNLLQLAESSGNAIIKILEKLRGVAHRSSRGNPRRKIIATRELGRHTHLVPFKSGFSRVAFLPSICNALKQGELNLIKGVRRLSRKSMLSWQRASKESFNLILLADSSRSTSQFLGKFADILKKLATYFKTNKDRMGLILIQGKQAIILNNPTGNYRVVARSLMNIDIGGETPLASGLYKALEMAAHEKMRNPGAKNLIVLISDCAPEPLTGECDNVIDEPAYQECLKAAGKIAARNIPMVIINPSFWSEDEHYPHEKLAKLLEKITRGRLIRLRGSKDETIQVSAFEMETILKEIETACGFKANQN